MNQRPPLCQRKFAWVFRYGGRQFRDPVLPAEFHRITKNLALCNITRKTRPPKIWKSTEFHAVSRGKTTVCYPPIAIPRRPADPSANRKPHLSNVFWPSTIPTEMADCSRGRVPFSTQTLIKLATDEKIQSRRFFGLQLNVWNDAICRITIAPNLLAEKLVIVLTMVSSSRIATSTFVKINYGKAGLSFKG